MRTAGSKLSRISPNNVDVAMSRNRTARTQTLKLNDANHHLTGRNLIEGFTHDLFKGFGRHLKAGVNNQAGLRRRSGQMVTNRNVGVRCGQNCQVAFSQPRTASPRA